MNARRPCRPERGRAQGCRSEVTGKGERRRARAAKNRGLEAGGWHPISSRRSSRIHIAANGSQVYLGCAAGPCDSWCDSAGWFWNFGCFSAFVLCITCLFSMARRVQVPLSAPYIFLGHWFTTPIFSFDWVCNGRVAGDGADGAAGQHVADSVVVSCRQRPPLSHTDELGAGSRTSLRGAHLRAERQFTHDTTTRGSVRNVEVACRIECQA